jgi:poly(A) polymerase/tRNA nucleotidyltransferase (CCA-adding enzyme)
MKVDLTVPREIISIVKTLKNKGFLAYLVGGCVRDCLIGEKPKDWDITTDAKPEQIVELYPKTFYENNFGTVTVVSEEVADETLRNVEITPFRKEGEYNDFRHPDKVEFGETLNVDLERRDFTVNALAYDPDTGELIDLFGGIKDIKDRVIRAVGEPNKRFGEDALRILRAVRLANQLGFTIEEGTVASIKRNAPLLKKISAERLRDELTKIIMSSTPMAGLALCQELGVLHETIPELEEGIANKQNASHIYTVWEHNLRALQHGADRDFPLNVRLAALFHDIGKPASRRFSEEKKDYTFYGHEVLGGRITAKIMTRLKFPVKLTDNVVSLVRNHMFFSDIDQITLSAVRRIIANVGAENVWDLMKVRACDRIGMGRPKEDPYRLRKYESMIEEALRAPTSVGMLKIDGERVMKVTRETPGPKIGYILHALLEEVLDKPDLNTAEYLENRAINLSKMETADLKKLGESGKEKKNEKEGEELAKIRARHRVK